MLLIYIIILVGFITGFLLSLKFNPQIIKDINKSKHTFYILYPLADWMIERSWLKKRLERKEQTEKSIKALYFSSKPEVLQRLYWCRRLTVIMVVLISFDVLALVLQLSDENQLLIDGKYLLRPDYGGGSNAVELNVSMEQQENRSEKKTIKEEQEVTIDVRERSYTDNELDVLFKKAYQYLEKAVIGSNESTDLIYKDLNFCKSVPGTGITVEWQPENYNLIQTDGKINNTDLQSEGITTRVKVVLKYRDQQSEHYMTFKIMPLPYKEEEQLKDKLADKIKEYDEKTALDSYLELPDKLGDYELNWSQKKIRKGVSILFFAAVTASLIWMAADKELEKQMKRRREQMLLDYPEIINKFTLLVNSGMTVRQAFYKIAEDYKRKENQRKQIRYAYEEMLITCHELQLGLPENVAYEQYGRRTGLITYIKFGSLMSQNLKKGSKGFTNLLIKEAKEAFEDRKETAKRLGEEAGTKLLIPMMVMLIIVFLIIMIPAFWSFQIV